MNKYRSFNSDNDANYFAGCVAGRLNIDGDQPWVAIYLEGSKQHYDKRYVPKLLARTYDGTSLVYAYFNAVITIMFDIKRKEWEYTVTGKLAERL